MVFEIWLKGDYNFGKLYELAKKMDNDIYVSEVDRGRFTMHIKGVEDVMIQFYSGGRIHVILDYYARPLHVMWIIRSLCFLASGRDPRLRLIKFWPLPEDTKAFEVRWIMGGFGRRLEPSWIDNLPIIWRMMFEDLLKGLSSDEHGALREFDKEDKPPWWEFLEVRGEGGDGARAEWPPTAR